MTAEVSTEDVLNLITPLEGNLKAAITLSSRDASQSAWLLEIRLMYDGGLAGSTTFNLDGYSFSEAEAVARNIRSNHFIMKEIDEFLWGESD